MNFNISGDDEWQTSWIAFIFKMKVFNGHFDFSQMSQGKMRWIIAIFKSELHLCNVSSSKLMFFPDSFTFYFIISFVRNFQFHFYSCLLEISSSTSKFLSLVRKIKFLIFLCSAFNCTICFPFIILENSYKLGNFSQQRLSEFFGTTFGGVDLFCSSLASSSIINSSSRSSIASFLIFSLRFEQILWILADFCRLDIFG